MTWVAWDTACASLSTGDHMTRLSLSSSLSWFSAAAGGFDRRRAPAGAVAAVVAALLGGGAPGCVIPNSNAGHVQVPSEVMRGGPPGEAASGRSRYVVRMTNGDQDWEFQLPEIATAYEVRVPLRGKPTSVMGVDQAALTAADKEIVGQREFDERARGDDAEEAQAQGEGGAAPGAAPKPRPAAAPSPKSSYLLTLAKVKELYRTRNYEVALVELVALEHDYPNDERIFSMKGSLYEKVGRKQLAREAWEAALAINPYNLQVAEALQRLRK
jgi:hypothetical protein